MRILIVFCLLLCAGCATQDGVLARQDYQASQEAFLHGDDKGALLEFPRSPGGGDFVTSEETAYLSLIQGKPMLAGLQKQEALLARTPQDYFPAPHELIWLHLLLAWGYADQGKYTEAAAEARLARNLLTLPSNAQGHFDDPILRVFLAGLWTVCDQWREARTDFHAAWVLDNSLGWAKELSAREQAPAQLFLVMGGPGPLVVWDPAHGSNPLRAARKVTFVLRGRKSALSIQDAHGLAVKTHLSPDAGPWYAHPMVRERQSTGVLHDLAFGAKAVTSGIEATAIITVTSVKDVLADTALGALAGAGILAVSDPTNNSSAFTADDYRAAAFVGAVLGAAYGVVDGMQEGYEASSDQFGNIADPATHFRYVRYLPEYLWVAWSDQPLTYPVELRTPLQRVSIPSPTVVNGTAVTLAHLADVYATLCRYSSEDGTATILTPPDKSGNCPPQPAY